MRAGIPVDVDLLRKEIRRTYTDVSTDQDQEFIVPTGRAWAQALGSAFEDARRKAAKFGAMGSTIRAIKPVR
jgi:hypothetical protein